MSELPWTSTLQVNRLYDLLDEGLVVLDNSGVIVHSNQAFADSLQYSAGDLLNRRFDDLIEEDQKGAFHLHLAADRGQPLDLTLVTGEGNPRATSVRCLGLIEDEMPKGFCLIVNDRDDHCPEFKRIVSSAYLKMVTVDTDYNITYVNPAFSEDASEIIGTPVVNGVGPEYREAFRQKLEMAMESGINQELEISESLEGNPTTWHVLRIGPIQQDTTAIGAVITGYEITDRVKVMRALQESEEKFRGVFEHANDAITLVDEEGRIVAINAAQEKLFGIKREAVIGMPLWELQASMLAESQKTPEFQKELQKSISDFFEEGTAPWLEKRTKGEFIHPLDGSHKTFEQASFRIPTSKGFMLCSFVWDITEETKTLSALDEVRERYELALKGADLGVWDWNAEDDEMVFSERWAEMLGYTLDEIEPNYAGWEKLVHPDDIETMESKWNDHVAGKTPFYSSEHRMRTKAGGWKWVLERGKVVELNEAGGTKRATGTLLDITERKVFEKALQQSEEKYRNLLDNLPQRVFYKNRDSVYITVNPAYAADLGVSPDEIIGKTDYDFYPKELADYFVSSDREVLESLETFERDESQVLEDETRYSQIVKAPVRDDEGNVMGILGIFWDTTETTRAAEALRESEMASRRDRNFFHSIAECAIQVKDTKELSRELLNIIISSLGFDFGTFRIYDAKKNVLQYSALLGAEIKDAHDELPVTEEFADDYIIVQTALSMSPIFISNLDEKVDDRPYLTRLQNLNALSAMAVPIIDEDKNLLGVLSLATRSPRSYTDGDKELFSTIANMLGAVLERKKAEEALQISERRYRELLTDISEGICIANLDERLLFVNNSFAHLLGYSAEELVGMSILDIIDPSDISLILKQTELRREGETSTYTHQFVRKDGEKRTVRTSAVPSRDDTGQIDGTVAIINDITERVKAEAALKESELKFRRVFESIPVAMHLLVTDEADDFLLVDANPAADKLFRSDHSQYIGKTLSELPLIHGANEIPTRFKEVMQTGEPWVVDEVAFDGEDIQMALHVQVFRTTKDTLVTSFLDITERMVKDIEIKKLNEGLTRMVDERTAELAAANKELEAFAYSVSHDLRAPLRTIDGFSQALMEDYSDSIDDSGKDFLLRVRTAAKHMGSLIEDLLVLSRVTRAEMDRTDVDLSEIVTGVAEELQDVDSERQVDIKITDLVQARCDRRLIKLVLQNLLDNAWKFTSKTSDARIEFGSMEREGEILFYVKDNGAGFNMEYSDKLFIPFQRLHQTDDFEGSGIGLATVQRIINRHGGRVWAESEVDEGSTFYFTIPESRSKE